MQLSVENKNKTDHSQEYNSKFANRRKRNEKGKKQNQKNGYKNQLS